MVPSWTGVAQPLKGTDLRLFPDLVHKPRGDPAAVATVSQGQENQYISVYLSIYQYHSSLCPPSLRASRPTCFMILGLKPHD